MGRRGPAPTPTTVKQLRGETRPSRLNRLEPMPSPDAPKMPAGMDPDAKVVWRRVVREMRGTDVILAADADVLRCYCEAVGRYAQAAGCCAQSGPLVRGATGELVKNPLHQVVRDNARRGPPLRPRARPLALRPGRPPRRAVGHALDIEDVLGPPPRLRVVGDEG